MNILTQLQPIRTFVFDIDGVLTDGQVHVQMDGSLLRSMNIKDGYALQLAVKKGYTIIIISGGKSEGCKIRLERLGISAVYIGVSDKAALLKELVQEMDLSLDKALYMGDDMPDIEAMKMCGVSTCPADACVDIKMISHYQSQFNGGQGCVRDVLEKVLRLNDEWE